MGKNINQIATAATSILSTDKMYIGRSPFGLTDDRYILGSSILSQLLSSATAAPVSGIIPYATGGGNLAMAFDSLLEFDSIKKFLTVGGLGFNDTTQAGLEVQSLTPAQIALLLQSQGNFWLNDTSKLLQYYDGAAIQTLITAAVLSNFGVTVGAGGDYPTLSAAFTAGEFVCRVISNVTETAGYTFSANDNVSVMFEAGVVYTFGNFSLFDFGANQVKLDFAGVSTQTINYTSNNALIKCGSALAGSNIIINQCIFTDLTTTANESYFIDGATNPNVKITLNNFTLNAANKNDGGIRAFSLVANNCDFVGGGAACEDILNIDGLTAITDCRTSGTFIATASGNAFNLSLTNIKGWYFDTANLGISTDFDFTASMISNSSPITIVCTSATSLNISQCNALAFVLFNNVGGSISQSVVYGID